MSSKKIILVTGPPGNGRDEYLQKTIPILENKVSTGYYHIFEYMKKVAPTFGIPNLTRENVLTTVSKNQLDQIRDAAFETVYKEITISKNEIEIVSTPSNFHIKPWGDYLTGKVNGLTNEYIAKLKPHCIIIFIDDLLRVRNKLSQDTTWKKNLLSLKDLADWRNNAIELVYGYFESIPHEFSWIIFAKEHPISTFIDIILTDKPRLYISYPITGEEDFTYVKKFINKLCENFICVDPYTIKDWNIVRAYDDIKEKYKEEEIPPVINITVNYDKGKEVFKNIPISEIEESIDVIRTQIVDRDLQLINCSHATVVYHKVDKPSYGVMTEVIHSRSEVSKPVYVLYPYRKRLSPFFEYYATRDNIVYGNGDLGELEAKLIKRLLREYPNWPTYNRQ